MDQTTNLGGEKTGRSTRGTMVMAEEIRCGWFEERKNPQQRKRTGDVSRQRLKALPGLTLPATPTVPMSVLIMMTVVYVERSCIGKASSYE
jgi:hypothetical protein